MKKIIIIGGGVSGLTAGIYAQQAGFQSSIYERNALPGGAARILATAVVLARQLRTLAHGHQQPHHALSAMGKRRRAIKGLARLSAAVFHASGAQRRDPPPLARPQPFQNRHASSLAQRSPDD